MEGLTFDVGLNTSGFNRGIADINGGLEGIGATTKKVGVMIAGALGGAAIISAMKDSSAAFLEYEKSFANVRTMMLDGPNVEKEWADALDTIGKKYGKMSEEVNEAAYTFLSATGGEGTKDMFDELVKASVAGYTDINTAASASVAVLKSWGLELNKQNTVEVLDKINKVVQKGQTDWNAMNTAIQAAAPLASTLGMTFDEVGAIMATFSGVTGSTSEVGTQLRAILTSLTKPSEQLGTAISNTIGPLIEAGKVTGELADRYVFLKQKQAEYSDTLGSLQTELQGLEELKIGGNLTAEDKIQYGFLKDQIKDIKDNMKEVSEMMGETTTGLVSASIEAEGFDAIISDIVEQANGNQAILAEMFGREEAIRLLSKYTDMKDQVLAAQEAIKNSTGSLDESFSKHTETIAFIFSQYEAASQKFKEAFGGLSATVMAPFIESTTQLLSGWSTSLKQATVDFVAWRDEFSTLETTGSKVNFAIEGIASFAGKVVDAAGSEIKDLSNHMRTEVLGLKPSETTEVDLEDLNVIVQGTLEIIDDAFEWASGSVDKLADLIRNVQGLEQDANETIDSGDIGVIVGGTLGIISDAFEWAVNTGDVLADFIRNKKGLEPDENEKIDVGDVQVIVGGMLDVAGEAFSFASGAVDGVADLIRNKKGLKPDSNTKIDIGDVKIIVAGLLDVSGEVFDFAEGAVDSVADYIREKKGLKPDENEKIDFGDVDIIVGGVLDVASEAFSFASGAIDSVSDFIRNKKGLKPDTNETIDVGDINVIASGVLSIVDSAFTWSAKTVDSVADYIRKQKGISVDTNETIDIGDINVIIGGTLDVIGEVFTWAGGAVDAIADFVRNKKGLELDDNETIDVGDINIIVEGALNVVGEAFTWAGGTVDAVADWIATKIPDAKPDDNTTLDFGDIATIIKGSLFVKKEMLSWAGGAVDAIADWIASKVPDLSADENRTIDAGDIATIVVGSLKLGQMAFEWVSGTVDDIADEIAKAIPEIKPDENEEFDIGDVKIFAQALWSGFKNLTTFVADAKADIDTLMVDQFGSGGGMVSDIAFAIPISFAVSKMQQGLSEMLKGVNGFGNKFKVVGDQVLNMAGTAGLSLGISVALSDMGEGKATEGAFKQAVAGALGIGVGALTGSVAAGQLTYGIVVAVETIVFDKLKTPTVLYESMEGGIKALKEKIALALQDGVVTGTEKPAISQAWVTLGNRLKELNAKVGWEQVLTAEQKEIKTAAENFYSNLGEELKKEADSIDFVNIGKNILDSLSGLTTERREEKKSIWSAVFGIDAFEAEKLESGVTFNIGYKVYNESEQTIADFISGYDSLSDKKVIIKADDQATTVIEGIEMLKINDKVFSITGKAGEMGLENAGSWKGSFSSGGYTSDVGTNTPAGVVHGGEWVAPAWMVNDSVIGSVISGLEDTRKGSDIKVPVTSRNGGGAVSININVENLVGDNDEAANVLANTVYRKLEEAGVLA